MNAKHFEKRRRTRNYASFFDWPNKELRELSVVEYLLESMQLGGQTKYSSPFSYCDDPPDCIVFDRNGKHVGVEVTEFVSAEAINRNQKGEKVYRDWELNEVIQALKTLILKKDGKVFHGGPYEKKILLIFTDEIILNTKQEEFKKICTSPLFGPVKQINEAYLLFSYDGIDRCPYIKLNLNRTDILD